MTAHSRRSRRGRTEVDIATTYFEEEKNKTRKIIEKKKRLYASDLSKKPSTSSIINSERKTQLEKKKKYPKSKLKRSSVKKSPLHSRKKFKSQKRRTVVKKGRENKKRVNKRSRAQYFQRYNI
jgi:hypothetical protein